MSGLCVSPPVCINNDFSEEEDSEEEEIKLCGILPAKKRGGRS